jgi:hypothetical protein
MKNRETGTMHSSQFTDLEDVQLYLYQPLLLARHDAETQDKFTFQQIIKFSVLILTQISSYQDIAGDNRTLCFASTRQDEPFKNMIHLRLNKYKKYDTSEVKQKQKI